MHATAAALCAAAPSYVLLLIARGRAGAFGGVLGAMVQTFVGDTIPHARRGLVAGIAGNSANQTTPIIIRSLALGQVTSTNGALSARNLR